jgi:hypothetical protein
MRRDASSNRQGSGTLPPNVVAASTAAEIVAHGALVLIAQQGGVTRRRIPLLVVQGPTADI